VSGPVPDDPELGLDLAGLDDPTPPTPDRHHRTEVARRSDRILRRRRARQASVVVVLVAAVSVGLAVGAGRFGSSGQHTASPPVPSTSTTTRSSNAVAATPSPGAGSTNGAPAGPMFGTAGCPAGLGRPTAGSWTGCEPAAPPGGGQGPNGRCDGSERAAPCASGAVTGRAYAVSLATGCQRRVVFDGRRWDGTTAVPGPLGSTIHAWMRLVTPTRVESTGPDGTVEWLPASGPVPACRP
jgi:hypothetical protein